MKVSKIFASSVLAGMVVGIGGIACLSVENRVTGAALFTIGLFTICTFGLQLFTGKVCYASGSGLKAVLMLPVVWLGNLAGTGAVAVMARASRIAGISERAAALCAVKTEDSFLSLFILGMLCNALIYIAVESYSKNPHETGKYIALFLGVMVFMLCGTEHCVADMFYFWMGGAWSSDAVISLLVITAGNCVGGAGTAMLKKYAAGP